LYNNDCDKIFKNYEILTIADKIDEGKIRVTNGLLSKILAIGINRLKKPGYKRYIDSLHILTNKYKNALFAKFAIY